MTAAKLEVQWNESAADQFPHRAWNVWDDGAARLNGWVPIRQIAKTVPASRCPHCDSIVYSRRSHLCGVCGEELPDSVRFGVAESERISELLQRERAHHRRWMSRVAS